MSPSSWLENPLFQWTAQRARRDTRFLLGLLLFGGIFYGVVALTFLAWWGSGWRRDLTDLCTSFHYVGWAANAIMLLLLTPARLAQKVGRDRELGTLEQLRLTGLSGRQLAAGELCSVLVLPLLCLVVTAPVMFLGLFGKGGPEAVLRGYVGLLACTPLYALVGGLIGLGSKKAQNAGGGAVFSAMVLLGLSSIGVFPREIDARPLGLLGPWGPGLATTHDDLSFSLLILGVQLPGELLQVPVLWVFSRALLGALGRRMAGDPGVALGTVGAATLLAIAGVVAALTLPRASAINGGWYVHPRMLKPHEAVMARLIALAVFSLPLALESPIGWRELVRGLTRRDPDDPVRPEEDFGGWRWLLGPGLILGGGLLLFLGALLCRPVPPLAGLVLGVLVALAAWGVGALACQVALLWSKDQGQPRVLATVAVVALWIGPLMAGGVLKEIGPSRAVADVAIAINPLVALIGATMEPSGARTGVAPMTMAVVCLTVHGLVGWGLLHLIRVARRRAQEFADSMVALPADAYGAPGTLTRRCPNGHLFAEEWTSCPHCPAEARPRIAPDV